MNSRLLFWRPTKIRPVCRWFPPTMVHDNHTQERFLSLRSAAVWWRDDFTSFTPPHPCHRWCWSNASGKRSCWGPRCGGNPATAAPSGTSCPNTSSNAWRKETQRSHGSWLSPGWWWSSLPSCRACRPLWCDASGTAQSPQGSTRSEPPKQVDALEIFPQTISKQDPPIITS